MRPSSRTYAATLLSLVVVVSLLVSHEADELEQQYSEGNDDW